MPRQRLTREQSKERTRQRLLDAAELVFRRRGYHGADVREIARRAGLTTGAVYWNFESKADLFLAVYEREVEVRMKRIAAFADLPPGGERAERAAVDTREWMDRERDWVLVLYEFRLHAARDPELNAKFLERYHRFLETCAYSFAGAGREVTPEVWDATTAWVALSNGFNFERINDPERVTPEQHVLSAIWLVDGARAHIDRPQRTARATRSRKSRASA